MIRADRAGTAGSGKLGPGARRAGTGAGMRGHGPAGWEFHRLAQTGLCTGSGGRESFLPLYVDIQTKLHFQSIEPRTTRLSATHATRGGQRLGPLQ